MHDTGCGSQLDGPGAKGCDYVDTRHASRNVAEWIYAHLAEEVLSM